jgi:hypothetical protein
VLCTTADVAPGAKVMRAELPGGGPKPGVAVGGTAVGTVGTNVGVGGCAVAVAGTAVAVGAPGDGVAVLVGEATGEPTGVAMMWVALAGAG